MLRPSIFKLNNVYKLSPFSSSPFSTSYSSTTPLIRPLNYYSTIQQKYYSNGRRNTNNKKTTNKSSKVPAQQQPPNQQQQESRNFSFHNFERYLIMIAVPLIGVSLFAIYRERSKGLIDEVPYTNRKRKMKVEKDWELRPEVIAYLESLYKKLISEKNAFPPNHQYNVLCKKILRRIVNATPELMKYNWGITVVDDLAPTAFITPNGKIVLNLGMLLLVDCEEELATVISHEVAHVFARHSVETYAKAIQSGMRGEEMLVSRNSTKSQTIESEADTIGLLLLARACYDPSKAPGLWKKLSVYEQEFVEKKPKSIFDLFEPSFVSHPTSEKRFENLSAAVMRAQGESEAMGCDPNEKCFSNESFWEQIGAKRDTLTELLRNHKEQKKQEENYY